MVGISYCDDDDSKELKTTLARQLSRRHMLKEGFNTNLGEGKEAKKKGGKTKLAGWKHFFAGATAGACEVVCTMPLDVVKTQMQINPGKYRHPIHAIQSISSTSGPKALYYGMPAFLIQTSGKAAIRFTAFAKCKEGLAKAAGQETVNNNPVFFDFLSGLCAGAAEAAVWTTPTERLKVLKQAEAGTTAGGGKHQNLLMSARTCVSEGGIANLFVGIVPTVIRQASSVGIRFMLYDPVKQIIKKFGGDDGTITYMMAGGAVGGLSVAINNPVDVIKNIAQSGKGDNLGTIGIGKRVYKENGIPGFFRGLSARVPRVFAGQAITFAAYEKVAAYLLTI